MSSSSRDNKERLSTTAPTATAAPQTAAAAAPASAVPKSAKDGKDEKKSDPSKLLADLDKEVAALKEETLNALKTLQNKDLQYEGSNTSVANTIRGLETENETFFPDSFGFDLLINHYNQLKPTPEDAAEVIALFKQIKDNFAKFKNIKNTYLMLTYGDMKQNLETITNKAIDKLREIKTEDQFLSAGNALTLLEEKHESLTQLRNKANMLAHPSNPILHKWDFSFLQYHTQSMQRDTLNPAIKQLKEKMGEYAHNQLIKNPNTPYAKLHKIRLDILAKLEKFKADLLTKIKDFHTTPGKNSPFGADQYYIDRLEQTLNGLNAEKFNENYQNSMIVNLNNIDRTDLIPNMEKSVKKYIAVSALIESMQIPTDKLGDISEVQNSLLQYQTRLTGDFERDMHGTSIEHTFYTRQWSDKKDEKRTHASTNLKDVISDKTASDNQGKDLITDLNKLFTPAGKLLIMPAIQGLVSKYQTYLQDEIKSSIKSNYIKLTSRYTKAGGQSADRLFYDRTELAKSTKSPAEKLLIIKSILLEDLIKIINDNKQTPSQKIDAIKQFLGTKASSDLRYKDYFKFKDIFPAGSPSPDKIYSFTIEEMITLPREVDLEKMLKLPKDERDKINSKGKEMIKALKTLIAQEAALAHETESSLTAAMRTGTTFHKTAAAGTTAVGTSAAGRDMKSKGPTPSG